MKSNPNEMLPIVDEQGRVTGTAPRAVCHGGSMLLHPVVHLHVLTGDGSVLLQKRAMTKDIQPGRWDTAVGGHVDPGESIEEALKRECREEIGLDASGASMVCSYIFESPVERELVYVHVLKVDDNGLQCRFAADEIDEVKFWTPAMIDDAMGRDVLTPNFEQEYRRLRPVFDDFVAGRAIAPAVDDVDVREGNK